MMMSDDLSTLMFVTTSVYFIHHLTSNLFSLGTLQHIPLTRYLFDVEVIPMDNVQINLLPTTKLALFVCSTTGQGEVGSQSCLYDALTY